MQVGAFRNRYPTTLKRCHTCHCTKASNQRTAGLLQPLPVPDYPFQQITMDLVTALPARAFGNNAVVVFVDRLSKMVHFAAIKKTITAEELAAVFFNHMVKLHGLPEAEDLERVCETTRPRPPVEPIVSAVRACDITRRRNMSASDLPSYVTSSAASKAPASSSASWVTAVTQDSLLTRSFAVNTAELPYTTQHATPPIYVLRRPRRNPSLGRMLRYKVMLIVASKFSYPDFCALCRVVGPLLGPPATSLEPHISPAADPSAEPDRRAICSFQAYQHGQHARHSACRLGDFDFLPGARIFPTGGVFSTLCY